MGFVVCVGRMMSTQSLFISLADDIGLKPKKRLFNMFSSFEQKY